MEPGFISQLLTYVVIILCLTGWKEDLFGVAPKKVLILVGLFWLFFESLQHWVLLIWIAVLFFIKIKDHYEKIHVLSIACLLGSFYLFIRQMYNIEPMTIFNDIRWDLPIIISLIALITLKKTIHQLVGVSAGIFLGDLIYVNISAEHSFASPTTFDIWWASYLLTRAATLLVQKTHIQRLWKRKGKSSHE